ERRVRARSAREVGWVDGERHGRVFSEKAHHAASQRLRVIFIKRVTQGGPKAALKAGTGSHATHRTSSLGGLDLATALPTCSAPAAVPMTAAGQQLPG